MTRRTWLLLALATVLLYVACSSDEPTAPPGPAIDPDTVLVAIKIWPDSVILHPGESVQFCAFAEFQSGRFGPTKNSYGIPVCDSVLASLQQRRSV